MDAVKRSGARLRATMEKAVQNLCFRTAANGWSGGGEGRANV
jgi:hypothetical protein